jgi:CPA2 family monovalent cation:H+ antiporter-2
MLAAPALIEIVLRLPVHGRVKPATDEPAVLKQHVIIAGFGLNGRNLARVLRETGIPYCVVDLNSAAVREGVSAGESIIYGDIMKREILMKAGISHAKVIVFAVSDPHSSRLAVPLCKQINPAVHIIVRTRYVSEITGLLKAGADTVIPEEFETSLQIFSKALSQYHVPMNVILQQINLIRQDSYEMLRADDMTISPKHLMDVITKSVTETFFIGQDFYAIGRSLRELDLRAKTNANVLAIVRESAAINTTTGTEIIQYGDIIVLMGTHQAVDAASALLQYGKP